MKLTGKTFKKHKALPDTKSTTAAKVANAASKFTDDETAIQIAKTAATQDQKTFDPMKEGYNKL